MEGSTAAAAGAVYVFVVVAGPIERSTSGGKWPIIGCFRVIGRRAKQRTIKGGPIYADKNHISGGGVSSADIPNFVEFAHSSAVAATYAAASK